VADHSEDGFLLGPQPSEAMPIESEVPVQLTVIVPTYNERPTLSKLLSSRLDGPVPQAADCR
jgi:hypothetical protein